MRSPLRCNTAARKNGYISSISKVLGRRRPSAIQPRIVLRFRSLTTVTRFSPPRHRIFAKERPRIRKSFFSRGSNEIGSPLIAMMPRGSRALHNFPFVCEATEAAPRKYENFRGGTSATTRRSRGPLPVAFFFFFDSCLRSREIRVQYGELDRGKRRVAAHSG